MDKGILIVGSYVDAAKVLVAETDAPVFQNIRFRIFSDELSCFVTSSFSIGELFVYDVPHKHHQYVINGAGRQIRGEDVYDCCEYDEDIEQF